MRATIASAPSPIGPRTTTTLAQVAMLAMTAAPGRPFPGPRTSALPSPARQTRSAPTGTTRTAPFAALQTRSPSSSRSSPPSPTSRSNAATALTRRAVPMRLASPANSLVLLSSTPERHPHMPSRQRAAPRIRETTRTRLTTRATFPCPTSSRLSQPTSVAISLLVARPSRTLCGARARRGRTAAPITSVAPAACRPSMDLPCPTRIGP